MQGAPPRTYASEWRIRDADNTSTPHQNKSSQSLSRAVNLGILDRFVHFERLYARPVTSRRRSYAPFEARNGATPALLIARFILLHCDSYLIVNTRLTKRLSLTAFMSVEY